MGKNKHKGKGGKAAKPATEPTLSKRERKALEEREAAIVEELDARRTTIAGATPDVTGLKGKALRKLVDDKSQPKPLRKAAKAELAARAAGAEVTEQPTTDEPPAKPKTPKGAKVKPSAKARTIAAAEATLASPGTEGAHEAAATAKAAAEEASDDESTESIKARVKAKRERRAELEAEDYRAGIDLDDHWAVRAYNAEVAELGGGKFLTSNAERLANDKFAQGDDRPRAELTAEALSERGEPAAAPKPGKAKRKDVPASDNKLEAALHGSDDQAAGSEPEPSPAAQAAEEVATEDGREFAVGTSVADEEFGKPSDAPRTLEEGRNGYKIIMLKDDGTPDLKRDGTPRTVRQLTRVTTYIANLEDKTNLERWKLRTLLEGVALNDAPNGDDEYSPAIPRVRDLMHVRDTAIAKAYRQDAKGKLEVGERGRIETAAVKAFKDAVNPLADDLLELGGVHDKANRGTNLHTLTELYDREGMGPIDDRLAAGVISKTDHASVVAYASECKRLGLKVVSAETVIVNDVERYAGRFDRKYLYKPEGAQRSIQVIGDIKSGRMDYGYVKVEQQCALYADGDEYDLETGARTRLGVNKHIGLLVHMPQGEGTCTIHVLDLDRGRRGNKLSKAVREWRSETGKLEPAAAL